MLCRACCSGPLHAPTHTHTVKGTMKGTLTVKGTICVSRGIFAGAPQCCVRHVSLVSLHHMPLVACTQPEQPSSSEPAADAANGSSPASTSAPTGSEAGSSNINTSAGVGVNVEATALLAYSLLHGCSSFRVRMHVWASLGLSVCGVYLRACL